MISWTFEQIIPFHNTLETIKTEGVESTMRIVPRLERKLNVPLSPLVLGRVPLHIKFFS